MKKKVAAVLMGTLLALSLAACGTDKEATGTDSGTNDKKADTSDASMKFGYVCMNLGNPWFVEVQKGYEDACKELGIDCLVIDSQYDVDKQVSDLETLVNDNYDAIMISPIDQNALKSIVDQANEADIVTSCMAQSQDNTDFGYICEEYDYGCLIGENAANWLNENLKDEAEVKVVMITQDNVEDTIARADGIQETLEKMCPNVNIVARQAGDTAEKGLEIVEGVLAQHPDLDMVVASNDSGGVGGYQAMANAGFTGKDKVAVFSGDATDEVLDIMKDGDTIYRGTVDLSPYKAAYDTVVKAADMVKNKQKNDKQEVFGFDMVMAPIDDLLDGTYVKGSN